MKLRPLGHTGLMVSPLGLGTVKLGRNEGVKYPSGFDLPDDAAALALLEAACDLGINLLDTAPAYGLAEARLGRLLPRIAGRRREDWLLVSKAGENFDHGVSQYDFSAEAVRASVLRSLERLGTPYLDAVLLHSDGVDEAGARFLPAVAALEQLKREGLIRLSGFSGKSLAGGMRMIDCVDLLMVTYNEQETEQRPLIELAGERGRGVLVKKALASGHSQAPGAALAAALAVPGVSSVVVGTLSPGHLRANMAAVAGQTEARTG